MAASQAMWQVIPCFRDDSVHSHHVPELQCPQGTAYELGFAEGKNCYR